MIRLIAYSDYLCPWCYNGSERLKQLRARFPDDVEVEYRSYLLRPEPGPRDLEKFRAYTQSWKRPAAEPGGAEFRTWHSDDGPPSHSIPPHLVAKAAAKLGPGASEQIHEALLRAYFYDSRDVSDQQVLRAIWNEAGLPEDRFEDHEDPAHLKQVIDEHNAAIESGVAGVPSVSMEGREGFLTGAQPFEIYERWITRALASA